MALSPVELPSQLYSVTFTPSTPGSPGSCIPFLFVSYHTKSPILAKGVKDTAIGAFIVLLS